MADKDNYIKQYKNILLIEIMNFLKLHYPVTEQKGAKPLQTLIAFQGREVASAGDEIYLIQCNKLRNPFQVTINFSKNCLILPTGSYRYPLNHKMIELSAASFKEQVVISDLLNAILTIPCGYQLWKSIQAQQEKMPGWWSFFSKQRTLSLAIQDVHHCFTVDVLMTYLLAELRDEIDQLKSRILQLERECKAFESEKEALQAELAAGNIGRDTVVESLHAKIDNLRAEQEEASEALRRLEGRVYELKNENEELNDENTQIHRDLVKLLSTTSTRIKSTVDFTTSNDPHVKDNVNRQHALYRGSSLFSAGGKASRSMDSDKDVLMQTFRH